MPVERTTGGTSLIDVLDRVLDKGIVIDAWVRVSLVGIDLITVRTDDPDPTYLRVTVLDRFDGDSWRPSERDIPPDQSAQGVLPPPPGLDQDAETEIHTWDIRISDDFESNWEDGREDITQQLDALADMSDTVVREFKKLDDELAKKVNDAVKTQDTRSAAQKKG